MGLTSATWGVAREFLCEKIKKDTGPKNLDNFYAKKYKTIKPKPSFALFINIRIHTRNHANKLSLSINPFVPDSLSLSPYIRFINFYFHSNEIETRKQFFSLFTIIRKKQKTQILVFLSLINETKTFKL